MLTTENKILEVTTIKDIILDYFRELYKCEFIGELKVTELNPGYKVSINLNHSESPLVIMTDLEGDEFLDFIYKEIRNRKLHGVRYDVIKNMQLNESCLKKN